MARVHHSYDVKSAYPSEMMQLPSMINGRFEQVNFPQWDEVEKASTISMFFVRWYLPMAYVDHTGERVFIPFFPLPYRLPSGGILFPSEGCGWYMRDEIIGVKRWLETFARLGMAGVTAIGRSIDIPAKIADKMGLPKHMRKELKRDGTGHCFNFTVCEAKFFVADESQSLPFAFIPLRRAR